ncbi:hypothetical protein BSKO_03470 [Bryopsis sp. KO-2023]|nr:hypothetical protein BSKO_03470 [Bryopsis sp. KO-2023]
MSGDRIFQGLEFFIDLDQGEGDLAGNALTSHLNSRILKLGGKVAKEYHKQCTHLVLRHEEQDLYSAAHQNDQSVVSVEYIVRCFDEGARLEEFERGIFKGDSIPGIGNHVRQLTLTDFRGLERLLLRYKCESTGAPYSGVLTVPGETSHLVVKDLNSTSEKVEKSRAHPSVHVVSFHWIEECLKQWKYVPEGPFKNEDDLVAESSQDEFTNTYSVPEGSARNDSVKAKAGEKTKEDTAGKKKSEASPPGPTEPKKNPKRSPKPGVSPKDDEGTVEEGKSDKKSDGGKAKDKRLREDNSPMGPSGTQSKKKSAHGKGSKKSGAKVEEAEGDDTGTEGDEPVQRGGSSSRKKVGGKRKRRSELMKGGPSRGEAVKKKPKRRLKRKEVSTDTEPSENEEEELDDEMEKPASPEPHNKSKGGSKQQKKTKNPEGDSEDLLFAVSGMEGEERTHMQVSLKKLGVRVSSGVSRDPHIYDFGTTHIISSELRRNEKTMCAMAAGNWVLSSDYVKSCRGAGDLVDEESFELSKTRNGVISEGAPAHWRNRFDSIGVGAFHGIKACFYGKLSLPGNDVIQQIITAGGGEVLKTSPPYADVLKRGNVTLAVIGKDKAKNADRNINMFLEGGVPCVSADYIISWIAHPDMDLAEFVLLDPEGGCEALMELENGRGAGGGASENSMSF